MLAQAGWTRSRICWHSIVVAKVKGQPKITAKGAA